MPTVFDDQGQAYDAVQVTQSTPLGGLQVPAGWWIVTNVATRQRSPVNPASFAAMFSPVQGAFMLGQPGGASQLDLNGKVIERLSYEAVPNGVATLDSNGNLVQTAGLKPSLFTYVTVNKATDSALTAAYQGDASQVNQWAAIDSNWYGQITVGGHPITLRLGIVGSTAQIGGDWYRWGIKWAQAGVDKGFINMGYMIGNPNSNVDGGLVFFMEMAAQIPAGTYTFIPIYQAGGPSTYTVASINPNTRATSDRASFSVIEHL